MESKKTGLIIGVVLIVLIAGGVVLSMSMNDDSDNNNDSSSSQASQQSSEQSEQNESEQMAEDNIVELASKTESLSTLVSAVKAAELVDTLSGAGPFTVFAPTNAAFEALPEGTLDSLLKPESKETLQAVLTYHVVSGKVMAADLKDGQEVKTVQGAVLRVSLEGGKAYLTDVKNNKVMVSSADVTAENGVVHVIDGVLLPQ